MSRNLVILTGPTAVGKTELSVGLAKKTGGEIISADSVQVYRGLDIGSAKVTAAEMQGVPHHLINCLDPDQNFSVVDFQNMAENVLDEIYKRGGLPILTGGTAFYIQALRKHISFLPEERDGYREKLEKMEAAGEEDRLFKMLSEMDPEAAAEIPRQNVRKVIRALEYYHFHHEKISAHNAAEREKPSLYNDAYFVLTMDRRALYERINVRVDQMFRQGLVQEVQGLLSRGISRQAPAMQAIGYRETAAYLAGELTEEEAKEEIKKNTRHFAKRQMTWFRREKDVIWLNRNEMNEDQLLESVLTILKARHII